MPLDEITIRFAVALLLGAALGLEREWRQRMAGLRTNILVAVGAASFSIFSLLFPEEVSPTRVGAQVVSGIGFLGAGVILRTGVNIQGLTTAATLWCAAAVGVLAGAGFLMEATVATAFILGTNVLLLPVDGIFQRRHRTPQEGDFHYDVQLRAGAGQDGQARALLLQGVSSGNLYLQGIESRELKEEGGIEVAARLVAMHPAQKELEQLVGRISLHPEVSGVSWRLVDTERAGNGSAGFFGR